MRILVVDLNNFARYPSIAIGYLVSGLRSDGNYVEVLAPLASGITGVVREPRPSLWGRYSLEFRYRTGVSQNKLLRKLRAVYSSRTKSKLATSKKSILDDLEKRLSEQFDIVMVSTYLMYYPHCVAIGRLCKQKNIPLIIGGPYFAFPDVASEWMSIDGLTALVGGEVEHGISKIVEKVASRQSLSDIDGIWHQQGDKLSIHAPPLKELDSVPFPDYTDFPWTKYPKRIVPIITGRGCGWGACLFCSDITSTAGRTFRSRSAENMFDEIKHQHKRHDCNLFVFTDLKLNSDLTVWRELITRMRQVLPDARWVGSVHVGTDAENGVSKQELVMARNAGMVRLTTGLESGSQSVLDRMAKGTDCNRNSQFLNDARRAGISVRTTMILGYPGETAVDVRDTAKFLTDHEHCIERVSLNRFQIMSGTRFAKLLSEKPKRFPALADVSTDHRYAQISHHYTPTEQRDYRRSVSKLLGVVHRINRKPILESARDFEGVM